MLLEFTARLRDLREHILHRISKLDAEPAENIALPSVILGIDPSLHLLVVDNACAESVLRLGGIEGCTSLLNLCEQLLPVRERVAEAVEDVFGFEIPEGLELEPFADIVFELLDFVLDEDEWSFQRGIREAS